MSSRFMLAGLKQARERLGLTQRQAAVRCRTSESVYQKWEAGKTNPAADKAEEVAKALGCSLGDLVRGFCAPTSDAAPAEGSSQGITREEFDELREKVERLMEHPAERRPSLYHDAYEIAERLGLVDERGCPVGPGCLIESPAGGPRRRVRRIELAEPTSMPGSGLATVTCVLDEGARLSAVDMRVKCAVVERAGR